MQGKEKRKNRRIEESIKEEQEKQKKNREKQKGRTEESRKRQTIAEKNRNDSKQYRRNLILSTSSFPFSIFSIFSVSCSTELS